MEVSMIIRYKRAFWFLLAILVMGGCLGSRPSRYYLLTSTSFTAEKSESRFLKIGINTIKFPDYLQRAPIVTNLSENQLNLAEFDRWAEPLSENFTRIMAENLVKLIPTDYVSVFPWVGFTDFDYQLTLEIRQFQLHTPSPVILVAYWQIMGKDQVIIMENQRSEIKTPVKATDYDTIVSAMSQSVEILSKEIADSINALAGGP
jgi:uncharacterized lipoprotein YmbA